MKVLLTLILAVLANPAFGHFDLIQRKWSVAALTPIIETYPDQQIDDPFRADGPLKTFDAFNDQEIKLWLQSLGVDFPSGSKVSYLNRKNGQNVLIVRNTPNNLGLIGDVLKQKYPVHSCKQLLDRFLTETESAEIAELPAIIAKYPTQALGPLENLVNELTQLEQQLASKLPPELEKIVRARRARNLKMLPKSLEATRAYFQTMSQIMAE